MKRWHRTLAAWRATLGVATRGGIALAGVVGMVSTAAAHSSTSAASEGGFQPLIVVGAVILLVLFFVFVDRHKD